MAELSIIIINYYSADFVMACLHTIYEQTHSVAYEVIVVDNASYDGCRDLLARSYPDVIFVQSQSNLGFGRANNFGTRHASGKVLLFLNPDTEIRERAIDCLFEHFKKLEKPGAVGCRLLNSDGTLQRSCVQSFPTVLNQILDADVLMRMFPKSRLWGAAALFESTDTPVKVEVISGACLMIQKKVFESIGGFSPEYFMYAEDIDLCYKARRAGLNNFYVGNVAVVHHAGCSNKHSISNFSNVMMRESVYRFLLKSHGCLYCLCYRSLLGGAAAIRMALLLVLYPAFRMRGKVSEWASSFRKWVGIMRWGLGLECWIRKYDSAKIESSC